MADFYVFETKVSGGVAPEIVDALALLKGESEALLESYQRNLDVDRYHSRYDVKEFIKLRELEGNVVSIVVASIKRQVATIEKRAERLRATAEFSGNPGDRSVIVMNHNIGGLKMASALTFGLKKMLMAGASELSNGVIANIGTTKLYALLSMWRVLMRPMTISRATKGS